MLQPAQADTPIKLMTDSAISSTVKRNWSEVVETRLPSRLEIAVLIDLCIGIILG